MTIKNAIASLAVKDLKATVSWYERLIGRPADSTPMPEVVEWKFAWGDWLQVYQLAGRRRRRLSLGRIDLVSSIRLWTGFTGSTGLKNSESGKILSILSERLDGLGIDTSEPRPCSWLR